jgi:hypothetical protein
MRDVRLEPANDLESIGRDSIEYGGIPSSKQNEKRFEGAELKGATVLALDIVRADGDVAEATDGGCQRLNEGAWNVFGSDDGSGEARGVEEGDMIAGNDGADDGGGVDDGVASDEDGRLKIDDRAVQSTVRE